MVSVAHPEKVCEVFEHSDAHFIEVLEELVKHRHEVSARDGVTEDQRQLVHRERQRAPHLPLKVNEQIQTRFMSKM